MTWAAFLYLFEMRFILVGADPLTLNGLITPYFQIIIEELHRRNHTIHVMQSSAYTDFLKDDFDKVTFIPFNVSFKCKYHNPTP